MTPPPREIPLELLALLAPGASQAQDHRDRREEDGRRPEDATAALMSSRKSPKAPPTLTGLVTVG
jgi:hypothetical protein